MAAACLDVRGQILEQHQVGAASLALAVLASQVVGELVALSSFLPEGVEP